MKNGSWEKIYLEQGKVQVDLLDTVVDAVDYLKKPTATMY